MKAVCNVVVTGVGGQGILSTAQLLGRAAVDADLDVRVGQIYGLSQRGGSVEATVRIGAVGTALIPPAQADVIVAFEPLEAERALPRMSATTTVLINATPIVPTSLTLGRTPYPEISSIVERIAAVAAHVHVIDGSDLALLTGDSRHLNLFMLGALDRLETLPIPSDALASAVEIHGSGPDPELRKRAFSLGRQAEIATVSSSPAGSAVRR